VRRGRRKRATSRRKMVAGRGFEPLTFGL
jgi:hypothetical protein